MAPCGLAHGNNHLGGDWAGNVYSSSGCPGSCVGESLAQNCSELPLSEKRLKQILSTTILALSVVHSSSSLGLRFTSETT